MDAADPPRDRNSMGFSYEPGSERVPMHGQLGDDVRGFVVYSYDPVGPAWSRGEAVLDPGGVGCFLRMVYDPDRARVVRGASPSGDQ